MRRSAVLFTVLSAILIVAVAQSCGPTCSEANCGGCCDANGRCASGSTADLCGSLGARCTRCPMGAQCLQQVCTIVQGTGGGAPAGCRSIDLIESNSLMGGGTRTTNNGQQTAWFTAWAVPVSPGSPITLRLDVQIYRPLGTTPLLPARGSFSNSTRFTTCNECIQLANTCDLMGLNCVGGDMIALAGSYEFTSVSSNTLAANADNLLFRPWNLMLDTPRTSDTNCIYVRRLTFDARW
jgi:hypothetical protein